MKTRNVRKLVQLPKTHARQSRGAALSYRAMGQLMLASDVCASQSDKCPGCRCCAMSSSSSPSSSTPSSLKPEQPDATAPALRILLVEDDAATRDMTVEMLQLLGHWVASVGSAEAARDRYMEGAFDVLMCDVGLPGLSGLDLVHSLQTQGVALLMVSGALRPATLPAHCGWLGKPYGLAQLEEALALLARPPVASGSTREAASNVVPLPTARLAPVQQRPAQPREGDSGTGTASGAAGGVAGAGASAGMGTGAEGSGDTIGKAAPRWAAGSARGVCGGT